MKVNERQKMGTCISSLLRELEKSSRFFVMASREVKGEWNGQIYAQMTANVI